MLFRSRTFGIVVHCLPFVSTAAQPETPFCAPSLHPTELMRVVNDPGFLIYGAPDEIWEQWDLTDYFMSEPATFTPLSIQTLR